MVREVRWYSAEGLPADTQEALRGVQIDFAAPRLPRRCCWLSSPDRERADLRRSLLTEQLENRFPKKFRPIPRADCVLFARIAPDDIVLGKLIAELARRQNSRCARNSTDGRVVATPAHVVILSEWDTPYGRSLRSTFTAEASGQTSNDIEQEKSQPQWIHSYHYLRGIDGQLPGEAAKTISASKGKKLVRSRDSRGRGNGRIKSVGLSSPFGAPDERGQCAMETQGWLRNSARSVCSVRTFTTK